MKKILGILLFQNNKVRDSYIDTSWINIFFKNKITEEIKKSCELIIRNINPGTLHCIHFNELSEELNYLKNVKILNFVVNYCYKSYDGWSSIIITKNYENIRIAQSLALLIVNKNNNINLKKLAFQYENPKNIDKLTNLQNDLDETIEILHESVEKILNRNDKIEHLIDRTDRLNKTSDIFLKNAKRMNRCCVIL